MISKLRESVSAKITSSTSQCHGSSLAIACERLVPLRIVLMSRRRRLYAPGMELVDSSGELRDAGRFRFEVEVPRKRDEGSSIRGGWYSDH
jgi:hypothetical protein